MPGSMVYYSHREGITPRKEITRMKRTDYTETTMEALIEEALKEMERKGEKLPEVRYGEKA